MRRVQWMLTARGPLSFSTSLPLYLSSTLPTLLYILYWFDWLPCITLGAYAHLIGLMSSYGVHRRTFEYRRHRVLWEQ